MEKSKNDLQQTILSLQLQIDNLQRTCTEQKQDIEKISNENNSLNEIISTLQCEKQNNIEQTTIPKKHNHNDLEK